MITLFSLEERENQRRHNRASYRKHIQKRRDAYKLWRADPVKVEAHKKRVKAWAERNKARKVAKNVAWMRQRRCSDPQYALRNRLASRLWHAVAKCAGAKAAKTQELLGCSVAEFRQIFEAKFKPGMTWERFMAGEIHIDHVTPCAKFDLTDPAQQRACFHFSNLQPLWALENLAKGAS